MSAPMTREERTQRLADLRARMAARNVTLSGGPLMSLPLHRRIAFAIADPGAITPRGDDYREPVHLWQARAVAFVVPESAEVDRLRARVAELEAARTTAAADRDQQIIAWLEKKAREEGTSNKDSRVRATATYRLADKLSRGAVRPACPPVSPEDPHESPLHHTYALGRDLPEVEPEQPAVTAERWNAQYPVGTPVYAYPGCRPEDDPKCTRLTTRTRSAASVLGGHTAVVWVEGHSACISLTHVDPRPEGGAL
ncbi:hypothetical protein [Streptomyces griseus]|uniref:hypothetical protein n=1 Tax=Streptomyces griseus TaxID=1911 RepID=UPI0033BFB0D0